MTETNLFCCHGWLRLMEVPRSATSPLEAQHLHVKIVEPPNDVIKYVTLWESETVRVTPFAVLCTVGTVEDWFLRGRDRHRLALPHGTDRSDALGHQPLARAAPARTGTREARALLSSRPYYRGFASVTLFAIRSHSGNVLAGNVLTRERLDGRQHARGGTERGGKPLAVFTAPHDVAVMHGNGDCRPDRP